MGIMVIAAFRPLPGKEAELLQITKEHLPILRSQNLVTDRPPYAMRAADGTILEVFEWLSQDAIDSAHSNPVVLKLWDRYTAASQYIPLSDIKECQSPFPGFQPLDLT